MRKIITTIALSVAAIAHPANAQDIVKTANTVSNKPSDTFIKLFRKMEAETTANEAYRVATAVKRARLRA